MKVGVKGLSVRKLLEYHLCPRADVLWESELMRVPFGRCAGAFRQAVRKYLTVDYEAASKQVSAFIKTASPSLTALYTRVQGWLADFHVMMITHPRTFEEHGLQAKVKVAGYAVRLDVALLELLPSGTKNAWILHDYVEEHLGAELADFGLRMAQHILATTHPEVTGLALYDYQRGKVRFEHVPRSATAPEYLPEAEALVRACVIDSEMKKKPGEQCLDCFHFKRNCNGPFPG